MWREWMTEPTMMQCLYTAGSSGDVDAVEGLSETVHRSSTILHFLGVVCSAEGSLDGFRRVSDRSILVRLP